MRGSWIILQQLIAADPNNARYRRDLVYALNVRSDQLEADGDLRGANLARRRSLELAEALAAAESGNQSDQIALAYSNQFHPTQKPLEVFTRPIGYPYL